METVDLTEVLNDFVLHYGGDSHRINAETLAKSLLCISNLVNNVNASVNPAIEIDLFVEAVTEGSFRQKLSIYKKNVPNLFSSLIKKEQIIPILISLFALHQAGGVSNVNIKSVDDNVEIAMPKSQVLVTKEVYEKTTEIYYDTKTITNITNNFNILSKDQEITEFGITKELEDKNLLFEIPKKEFKELASEKEEEDNEVTRTIEDKTFLQIIKPIFQNKTRKWEFVWRGVKIPAKIEDENLFTQLENGLKFGLGDQIEATLIIKQILDPSTKIWINKSYSLGEYHNYIPAALQAEL